MKKITLFFLLLMAATILNAQPNTIKYQAIIRDAEGKPVKNQSISLTASLYDSEIGGNQVWSETQNVQTNEFGLVVISLGSVSSLDYSMFEGGSWLETSYYLGGDYLTIMTKLESVPYSLISDHANSAEHSAEADHSQDAENAVYAEYLVWQGSGSNLDADLLDGYDSNDLLNLETILNHANDAGGNFIVNLADPINPQDAATKYYVDNYSVKLSELEKKIAETEQKLLELENKISELNNQ